MPCSSLRAWDSASPSRGGCSVVVRGVAELGFHDRLMFVSSLPGSPGCSQSAVPLGPSWSATTTHETVDSPSGPLPKTLRRCCSQSMPAGSNWTKQTPCPDASRGFPKC